METPATALAFDVARAVQRELEAAERAAATALRSIPGVGSGPTGMTPDAVKSSAAYLEAKRAHESAFQNLRRFNAAFVRRFKRELAADRRRAG